MKDLAARRLYEETGNWLSRGRAAVIAALLNRHCRRNGAVLEVGAGSGASVALLARYGRVDAIEVRDDALARLRKRPELRTLYQGAVPEVKLDRRYSLVGTFDVIEHIRDERAALSWVVQHLEDDGLFVATVPAYRWLFSAHDVANQHYRRYSRRSLIQALPMELTVRQCGYFNTTLFPAAVAARATWSMSRRLSRRGGARAEDKQPSGVPRVVDKVFCRALCSEAALIKSGVTPPFGLSVFCVAQKIATGCSPRASAR